MTAVHGVVAEDLQPRVDIMLIDAAGNGFPISIAIDTGFHGFLALPKAIIDQFDMQSVGEYTVILADGSSTTAMQYYASVRWLGKERKVRVVDLGGESLLGLNLMWNNRLIIDVLDGGKVQISPLDGSNYG